MFFSSTGVNKKSINVLSAESKRFNVLEPMVFQSSSIKYLQTDNHYVADMSGYLQKFCW